MLFLYYCGLGVHTATNQHNERKFEFYWGYRKHILTVALELLSQTNELLTLDEITFIADKGYDVKLIYNTVKEQYHGECYIPLNKRNSKDTKKLKSGHPICEAGLAMHKDGKFSDNGRTRQKYCCRLIFL